MDEYVRAVLESDLARLESRVREERAAEAGYRQQMVKAGEAAADLEERAAALREELGRA